MRGMRARTLGHHSGASSTENGGTSSDMAIRRYRRAGCGSDRSRGRTGATPHVPRGSGRMRRKQAEVDNKTAAAARGRAMDPPRWQIDVVRT